MENNFISNGEDYALEHFGVQGMRWGIRKGVTSDTLSSRNSKLEKKQVRVDTKRGKVGMKKAKFEIKRGKRETRALEDAYTNTRANKKLKKSINKVRKATKKYAKLEKKSVKIGKQIHNNKQMISYMSKQKISTLNPSTVNLGKSAVTDSDK